MALNCCNGCASPVWPWHILDRSLQYSREGVADMKRLIGLAVCAILALSSTARAQGIQTGTITGIVQSSDGLSLPGVTVTATPPSLQGQRTAVTDVDGVYFIKGLPAGTYSVTFNVASFETTNTDEGICRSPPRRAAAAGHRLASLFHYRRGRPSGRPAERVE
jgi:hypothetical protein